MRQFGWTYWLAVVMWLATAETVLIVLHANGVHVPRGVPFCLGFTAALFARLCERLEGER